MSLKSLLLVAVLLSLAFFPRFSSGANNLINSSDPYFSVQSSDDKELTLEMIKGKVAAIFYENKDVVENNMRLTKGCIKQTVLRADADRKRRFSATPHYRLFGRSLAVPGKMEKKTQETL